VNTRKEFGMMIISPTKQNMQALKQ
jgi:hypothetical protein